mmetsp:Transcript_26395/g.72891  ORF Transcript_26395/g.72891 Transcript_26395/m.72891 type:complete len:232 (-) Transcript_26395:1107-1802(-)
MSLYCSTAFSSMDGATSRASSRDMKSSLLLLASMCPPSAPLRELSWIELSISLSPGRLKGVALLCCEIISSKVSRPCEGRDSPRLSSMDDILWKEGSSVISEGSRANDSPTPDEEEEDPIGDASSPSKSSTSSQVSVRMILVPEWSFVVNDKNFPSWLNPREVSTETPVFRHDETNLFNSSISAQKTVSTTFRLLLCPAIARCLPVGLHFTLDTEKSTEILCTIGHLPSVL